MRLPSGLTKINAFCCIVILVATVVLLFKMIHSDNQNLYAAQKEQKEDFVKKESNKLSLQGGSVGVGASSGSSSGSGSAMHVTGLRSSGVKQYRFHNGRIAIGSSIYDLSPATLGAMSAQELEILYENVVLEITVDCSTVRRLGLREDGGWDLCLVGDFTPAQPCFSFSFGINNIWGFDDEVASTFKCQVLTFDPSMSQKSHMRNDKVAFFKEGLHGSNRTLNTWSVNTYLGFLKRFKAESYVIDILKIDIEASEWDSLKTALKDGSLKNVKQLMIETHISTTASVQDFLYYFSIIKGLYDAGFRQWRHNWNTYGNFHSKLNGGQLISCCHELYYVNINFLTSARNARNPSGTQIAEPLSHL